MTDLELDTSSSPAFHPAVRTTAYVVALVAGAVCGGAITTMGTLAAAGVVDGDAALLIAAVSGGVLSVVTTIAGGLGVVFRPRA
ncbi:hypothetical protein E4U02_14620 [Microbacterium paludicola]|uniref:Uncharacterized protein n=1 Tax=Microbacterium paludicola TaxID=300019 RepID=A0A4Y9FMT1_9MICO|nr:hypothetical protein [Microbacterium paludicola]MBF0817637.1 hypothetical protein [Microbacterium paludicola]TFU30471.1 hypothetical protein E4U02_14620 [Microbacterium paludicola]